jgi:hypothetical protein
MRKVVRLANHPLRARSLPPLSSRAVCGANWAQRAPPIYGGWRVERSETRRGAEDERSESSSPQTLFGGRERVERSETCGRGAPNFVRGKCFNRPITKSSRGLTQFAEQTALEERQKVFQLTNHPCAAGRERVGRSETCGRGPNFVRGGMFWFTSAESFRLSHIESVFSTKHTTKVFLSKHRSALVD